MDLAAAEHSDSDSGESWILLEQETISPAYTEASEFSEKSDKRNTQDDKEEDTDGISIISDSDHDSIPGETFNENNTENENPEIKEIPRYISVDPLHNDNMHYDSMGNDQDFLGDANGKMKTYVHKRNKRLSTVLNVIVLGSVITAAGIAIGHMWGVRDDCNINSIPSVNKILSNLYKLQEENAYLRNKLKELSMFNNIQQQKLDLPQKHHRCKKMFEESLENKNVERITKCVDGQSKPYVHNLVEAEYEKQFLNEIKKLKNIYKQNKTWLDEEIAKRLKHEQTLVKAMKPKYGTYNHSVKNIHVEKQLNSYNQATPEIEPEENPKLQLASKIKVDLQPSVSEKKVTYADSLKVDQEAKRVQKREINEDFTKPKGYHNKKKQIKEYDIPSEHSFSEEQSGKDDRHHEPKHKVQHKKQDRQKLHKKQKRKNKYEQWEMKGGYLKYYDDISATSSQENFVQNPDKNDLSKKFDLKNYIKQFSEAASNTEPAVDIDNKIKFNKPKSTSDKKEMSNWYDKRASLRNEARKRLEKELFGISNPNSASWYFRRMQRREKCRVKGENVTNKRHTKRNMNFKTRC